MLLSDASSTRCTDKLLNNYLLGSTMAAGNVRRKQPRCLLSKNRPHHLQLVSQPMLDLSGSLESSRTDTSQPLLELTPRLRPIGPKGDGPYQLTNLATALANQLN